MRYLFFILLIMTMTSCGSSSKLASQAPVAMPPSENNVKDMRPKAIIYKTISDFSDKVPLTMNATRTEIVSYPAPQDVVGGEPTILKDGYLLDNRGIGLNTVFTDYTYTEYAKMKSAPSLEELKKHIIEQYPLIELYATSTARESGKGLEYYNKIIDSGFVGCINLLQ
ncbi:MAG: hypothetical protein PHR45_07180 [Muribaculaceae bacterium]|nr:hypothetical protein [Muribaculaceae bacterium]